jgi:hypothetical protein
LVAACSLLPGPSSRVNLGVSNGTTLAVSLFVNGQFVNAFVPGQPAPPIDTSVLPPLPWRVEARSASGRLLTSMHIEPGQVGGTTQPGGFSEYTGTMGRVDLSCGRLTIWGGDMEPSGPAPPPNPGVPGDCAP